MLSFRLDASLLRKVDMLRLSRHRTRGEIIREAVEMYDRVHNPVISTTQVANEDTTKIAQ